VNRDAALEVITLRELPQLFTQRRIRRKDQTNYYLQLVILFARGFVQTQVEAQALNLGANFSNHQINIFRHRRTGYLFQCRVYIVVTGYFISSAEQPGKKNDVQ
jgi:hypothetical protein